MKEKVFRILDSAALLPAVLSTTLVLGLIWHQAQASTKPPEIRGWNWEEHPNALLLSRVPDACGCSGSPESPVVVALGKHLDAVVVASHTDDDLESIKKLKLPKRLSVFTNVDATLVKDLSPHAKTSYTLVRDGIVVRRVEGGVPSDNFWR